MLCLDKTGTITDGTMSVRKIECAKLPEDEIKKILALNYLQLFAAYFY